MKQQLAQDAAYFHAKGWMVGTAGNLSAKEADGSFWITASGVAKHALNDKDFVRINTAGEILEGGKPSAETSIHQAIYQIFPEAGACYHVHSVEANLVSHFGTGWIELPSLEMIKGFGIWKENPRVLLPIFENHAEVPKIAEDITRRFKEEPPAIPALLIRHHGVTVWGKDTMEARHRIELAEFIFRYMVEARRLSLS